MTQFNNILKISAKCFQAANGERFVLFPRKSEAACTLRTIGLVFSLLSPP